MKHGVRILYNEDAGGGGGGGGSTPASDQGAATTREGNKRREMQETIATQQSAIESLQGKFDALNKTHEKAMQKLSGFEARDKRADALKAGIEIATKKAEKAGRKIAVNSEKALKYLSRGDFNEETLAAEVDEAIELFSEAKGKPAAQLDGNDPEPHADEECRPKLHPFNKIVVDALSQK